MKLALAGCLVVAVTTLLSSIAFAQARIDQAFTVGENILVSATAAERPLVEPQVVAHPKDPKHLLAVAISSSEPPHSPQADCAAFVSFDGGQTLGAT